MRMYKEVGYAKQRLLETCVRYNNKAVLVKDITGGEALFKYILSNDHGSCHPSELNIDPVPLGYANTNDGLYYLTRIPMREDWKQGLRMNTLRDHRGLTIDIGWKSIAKTIENIYPTIPECFKLSTKRPVAFSRNFAINIDKSLIYKGKYFIGKMLDVDKYTLEGKYEYLKEVAAEEIGFENSN